VYVNLGDPTTVAKLIEKLKEMYGNKFSDNFLKNGKLFNEMVILLINGLNLKQFADKYANPMDILLKENDDIVFLVQFGGG